MSVGRFGAGRFRFTLPLLLFATSKLFGAALSDPAVDAYNVRVGTQTFSGLYKFTTNTLLVETANAVHDMGSDILKMEIAPGFSGKYNITLGSSITNLVTLVRNEPSCRHVFDMPFRSYVLWTYPFASWWPFDGYSTSEASSEYKEFYDLTRYLLTNYNNSGKTFYLGHWEGDGYLCPNSNWTTNPTPTMVQGFVDCLNNRQKAIDDAKHATGFTNVNVFCYAEANRVRDAINGYTRMINAVIPNVTNLDYVSYSSYDMQRLSQSSMTVTLDYMESHLPTNKAGSISGERIWIGEYGYANAGDTPVAQEPETRSYIQFLLNYGQKGIKHILFWEIYDNETNSDGSYRYFYLIDPANNKVPCYYLHQRFINNAKLLTAQFKEQNSRLPSDTEFVSLVSPMLNQPLIAPINLSLVNLSSSLVSTSSAILTGSLAQGVYGDDRATVRVYWGPQDGGALRSAWEQSQTIAVNTNFNPRVFSTIVSNLISQTNYYFRFYATNASGESWAPASSQFSTTPLNPTDYGSRMKIAFTGYNRSEILPGFKALVNLSTNLPGFSYKQFASSSGADLRFTDSNGIGLLAHEIDEWNTNSVSSIWVKLPALSSTNDFIWAYWGNPLATDLPAYSTNGAVWASDHYLVWHLKEPGFPYSDSAQQHPSLTGVTPSIASGVIGHGVLLNGTSQFLDAGTVNLGNTFTLSAWANIATTAPAQIQTIWANQKGGYGSAGFAWFVNTFNTNDHKIDFGSGDGTNGNESTTAANAVSFGAWHHLAVSVNRTNGSASYFIDGSLVTNSSAIVKTFANNADVNLGRFTNSDFYFKGLLDEVRIESTTRSSNWVWAAWMNVVSNESFSSYAVPVQQSPVLSIAAAGANHTLSWPSSGVGFTLAVATNLTTPVSWFALTNQPTLTNSQWQVSLPAPTNTARFYRLQSGYY